mgnify:CR=1 FL=1
MTLDSTVVVPALFLASYSLVGLLALGGKVIDWAFTKLEDDRRITIERNECPTCKRVEDTGHRPFDADLGWYYTRTYMPCLSCRHMANETIELDLDVVSIDTIRSLDPDHQSEPHGAALDGPPACRALGTRTEHRQAAG